jgi:serine/threonine protein kinase
MIATDSASRAPPQWDDTQKFIVIYGVAVGMMILHSRRVIHRDLKPANILLNEAFEPVIADFGFSKFINVGESQLSRSNSYGTAEFEAPELLNGRNMYSFNVDVFAYAMVVYNIFTKKSPYYQWRNEGDRGIRLIGQAIQRGDRPSVGILYPFIQDLVNHCWQYSPAERPTFEQIVEEFHRAPLENFGVNMTRFEEYRRKVFPESFQIPKPIYADNANLRQSAESGNAADANRLGCYYRDGTNVPRDPVQAARYFGLSARHGDTA